MFIAALFAIAKIWKKPKCPSTDEWIKKMWYISIHTHTHKHTQWNITQPYWMDLESIMDGPREYHGWTQRVSWMDLESIMLSEISQTEENKYPML